MQRKIAFISGDRIFWGAEAIIELCRWFDWPYPLARFGYLVPKPLRDVLYQIVADNRYRWCAAGPYRHRTLPCSSRCWLPQVWDPGAGQELCAAAVPVLLLQEEGRGQEGRRGRCQGGGGRGGRGHTGRRRPRRGRGACASSRPAGCC